MLIKKGCVARCKAGMLGLVTSDEPGKGGWVGIQLSPDKAGRKWTSTDPQLVSYSMEHIIENYLDYLHEEMEYWDKLYNECIRRGLINQAIEDELDNAGAQYRYSNYEMVDFLIQNQGPSYLKGSQ